MSCGMISIEIWTPQISLRPSALTAGTVHGVAQPLSSHQSLPMGVHRCACRTICNLLELCVPLLLRIYNGILL